MELYNHPAQSRALGKPTDWDEQRNGPVEVLTIRDVVIDHKPFMESLWMPTDEERAAIANGAAVVLWVAGTGHPVVSLSAVDMVALAALETEIALDKAKKGVDG